MRRAFAETLTRLADNDPRIIFLTGDLGFQVFDDFKARHGPRYVNVGVAEAQMVCVAAGLAATGWRPVCYSIASFLTNRAFEQIRISVNYPELPVVIVGVGGGYNYSSSGVTHHAVEDFALMSVMPGMTVVAPGDPDEVRALLPQLFQIDGPSYIRIGGFGEPVIPALEPAVLGQWRLMRNGHRFAVISVGDVVAQVAEALQQLGSEGISPAHFHAHTVKPLDEERLSEVIGWAQALLVVEEHGPIGGMGDAINRWLCEQGRMVPMTRLGVPDRMALGNPHRPDLLLRLGYDAASIAETGRQIWKQGPSKGA